MADWRLNRRADSLHAQEPVDLGPDLEQRTAIALGAATARQDIEARGDQGQAGLVRRQDVEHFRQEVSDQIEVVILTKRRGTFLELVVHGVLPDLAAVVPRDYNSGPGVLVAPGPAHTVRSSMAAMTLIPKPLTFKNSRALASASCRSPVPTVASREPGHEYAALA